MRSPSLSSKLPTSLPRHTTAGHPNARGKVVAPTPSRANSLGPNPRNLPTWFLITCPTATVTAISRLLCLLFKLKTEFKRQILYRISTMLMPEPTLLNSIIYWVVVFSILLCSNRKFRCGLTKNRIIAWVIVSSILLYSNPGFRSRLMKNSIIAWTLGHLDLVLLLPILAATLYLKKI
jgi:hypothetical protein